MCLMLSDVLTYFPAPETRVTFPPTKDVDREGDENTGLPPKDPPLATSQIQMPSKFSQNLASTEIPPHTAYFSCLPGKVKEEKAEERSEAQEPGYFSWARARSALDKNKLCKKVCCVVQGHHSYRGQCT